MGRKKNLLSIGEASKYLGVSRDTLRRWEKKGKVTPRRSPTNRRYYTKDQLDALIKKPKADSKKPASSKTKANSLKLAIYSLAALVVAVIVGVTLQLILF